MNSKRENELQKKTNNSNLEQTRVHKVKPQDTIFGDNNYIKNDMRKRAMGDTMAPKSRKRKSSRDESLDFDPFLEETIYDEKYKRSSKKNNSSIKFVIITLVIAVLACISFFAIAFTMVLKPSTDINIESDTSEMVNNKNNINNQQEVIAEENLLTITGIIKKYDISNNTISILDINDRKNYTFIIDGKTKLYDQYEKTIVFAELSIGDIVDVTFDTASVYITEIRKNQNTFTEKRATGIEIDTASKTVKSGSKIYTYNNDIIVTNGDEDYSISEIDITDTVSFSGYKDIIYRIDLIKGHGTLEFTNIDVIENGVVEIDTDILFKLENQTRVNLGVGDHNLVIKGDNIDVYTNQIFVEQGEVIEIDLTNLPSKKGLLTIKSNVSNVQVMIDGVVYTDPIMLPYGTYVVTVSAQDFIEETKTVIIDKSQQELSFQLNPVEKNARIVIDTNPTGAEVYMDNKLIGLTTVDTKIEVGYHEFTISLEGYKDKLFTRDFEEDTYRYTFEMIPNENNEYDDLIIQE